MTRHKHADFFNAIAEGESLSDWEYRIPDTIQWSAMYYGILSALILEPEKRETRRKLKAIRIGNVDVPEPIQVAPAIGVIYWVVCGIDSMGRMAISHKWNDDEYDHLWLKRGICHTTEKAAEEHFKALTLVSGGTCVRD